MESRIVSMKHLEELQIDAPHIGDDFVRVDPHEAGCMDYDPVKLRRMGEAVPIDRLHLSCFVGME